MNRDLQNIIKRDTAYQEINLYISSKIAIFSFIFLLFVFTSFSLYLLFSEKYIEIPIIFKLLSIFFFIIILTAIIINTKSFKICVDNLNKSISTKTFLIFPFFNETHTFELSLVKQFTLSSLFKNDLYIEFLSTK